MHFGSTLVDFNSRVAHARTGISYGNSARHHDFSNAAYHCYRPLGAVAAARRRSHQHLVVLVHVIFDFRGELLELAQLESSGQIGQFRKLF